MPDSLEKFSAQLVMKDESGSSILDREGGVTADNVTRFRVSEDRVAFVRRELEKLGFDVPQGDSTTLSVTGPRELFADVFGLEAGAATRNTAAHATRIPGHLSGHVADVFVAPGPEFFP